MSMKLIHVGSDRRGDISVIRIVISTFLFLGMSHIAIAATIHVPADQLTIQAGIDAATDGDTVLVSNGTFFENISFLGKAVTVAGPWLYSRDSTDIINTIIDGSTSIGDSTSVVRFTNAEDSRSQLIGFTIMGGYGTDTGTYWCGGGIFCVESSPTISNCRFVQNTAYYGAGIYMSFSDSALIEDCVFAQDTVNGEGAGIKCNFSTVQITRCSFIKQWSYNASGLSCYQSTVSILDCLFHGLSAIGATAGIECFESNLSISGTVFSQISCYGLDGVMSVSNSSLQVQDCLFTENFSNDCAGIYCSGSTSLRVSGCTFYGNNSWSGFEGSSIHCWEIDTLEIHNSIFAYASSGEPVSCFFTDNVSVTCTDVYGNADGNWELCLAPFADSDGNMSLPPQFCDTNTSNFGLNISSPCRPSNNQCDILIGKYDAACGFICGDCDTSGGIDIDDAVFLIAYIFSGGPGPISYDSGDADCSESIDIDDVVYLIGYIFSGGPEPCAGCS